MVKILKKLNMFLILSAFSAGIVFCLCGFALTVPKGVVIDGVPVGGMTYNSAVALLRKNIEDGLKDKQLVIYGKKEKYTFCYPEISCKDNLYFLVRKAEKYGKYTSQKTYYLCGLDKIAAAICLNERVKREEPHFDFNPAGAPFVYHEGCDGAEPDALRLKTDVLNSLKGGFEDVKIAYRALPRCGSVQILKEETVLLGEYTTYFDSSNSNRASNIKLAAAFINGKILSGGEELSFNDTVGARLVERGFLSAKIIENGEYVEGVGGGVCQVSTTLYNAALLSGLKIAEYHPHSLAVGYVAPSRDAMVSGEACDLRIVNPYRFPVYIRAKVVGGSVNFKIYGKSDGAKYSLESAVTGSLPPEEEICPTPEQAQDGKDGILSESYLIVERDGYIKKIKLRTDKYLPTKRLVYLPPQTESAPNVKTDGV